MSKPAQNKAKPATPKAKPDVPKGAEVPEVPSEDTETEAPKPAAKVLDHKDAPVPKELKGKPKKVIKLASGGVRIDN
tara:strand:- start:364 stop:594 length:231 start_codon:yes stop_codon:yes gene_type:complete